MEYRIVADSSCDLNEELKNRLDIGLVPLKIDVDGHTFVDNHTLNIKKLLSAMKKVKIL